MGGAIGVLLIAPQIPHMSVLAAFLVIAGDRNITSFLTASV